MDIFMAGLTHGEAIVDGIAQLRTLMPCLDVRDLHAPSMAALLPLEMIAAQNSGTPGTILIGVAFFIGIGLALGSIATRATTKLDVEMAAFRIQHGVAPDALQGSFLQAASLRRMAPPTRGGACWAQTTMEERALKQTAADDTPPLQASWAS